MNKKKLAEQIDDVKAELDDQDLEMASGGIDDIDLLICCSGCITPAAQQN